MISQEELERYRKLAEQATDQKLNAVRIDDNSGNSAYFVDYIDEDEWPNPIASFEKEQDSKLFAESRTIILKLVNELGKQTCNCS